VPPAKLAQGGLISAGSHAMIDHKQRNPMTASNSVRWNCEMTDTFGGEANYGWVRRGATRVIKNATQRQIVKAVKAELGITGVPCKTFNHGDMIEMRPIGQCTVVFATVEY